ncbi:MAG: hypothetical protein IJ198_05595 [Lachnospiraceae bacterium]|nr:hypothetical protein [Lachnospiraceae bacterium]
MIGKLIIEILILWIIYALYMAILVHKRGPLGGIFFYPRVMQERVIETGLMTEQELKSRRTFAYILLLALMILVPGFMILCVNGAQTYFSCFWQFYVLFLGAEFFDWLVIDTIWVAMSDWWIIPGMEDLNDTWHSVHVKQWKMLKLIPLAIPVSAIIGALYWGIRVLTT